MTELELIIIRGMILSRPTAEIHFILLTTILTSQAVMPWLYPYAGRDNVTFSVVLISAVFVVTSLNQPHELSVVLWRLQ